jgi:hypothetical protein
MWEVGRNLVLPYNIAQCTRLSGTASCRNCCVIYRREGSVPYRNIPSVNHCHIHYTVFVTTVLSSNLVETSGSSRKTTRFQKIKR